MKNSLRHFLVVLTLLLAFLAGSLWSRCQAEQADAEAPPVAYAWGHQLTVYYPNREKLYVYTELGGTRVLAYTLSTPGGPITRENCKVASP